MQPESALLALKCAIHQLITCKECDGNDILGCCSNEVSHNGWVKSTLLHSLAALAALAAFGMFVALAAFGLLGSLAANRGADYMIANSKKIV